MNTNDKNLVIVNTTLQSMVESLDRAEEALKEDKFRECESQLKLYDLMYQSASRNIQAYDRKNEAVMIA